jgi:signal transduction histidine kinase
MKRRSVLIDSLLAAAAFAISVAALHRGTETDPELRDPDVVAYALLAIYSGVVAVRSRFPLGATVVGAAAGFVYAAAYYPLALTPALLLPVYTAATRLEWRSSRRLLLGLLVVGALGATLSPGPTDVAVPVLIGAAWLLGHYIRAGRVYTAELEQKNQQLQRAQYDLARQAVMADRLRIARDLHDAVAHTMSVVAVHAGSARMIGAGDPAATHAALDTIERASRSALVEMRRLLGVLRTPDNAGDDTSSLDPAPGLRDLDGLVADVVKSGVTVQMRVLGERPEVPPVVDLCAYRIVQEALTNVIKHAGPVRVTVTVRYYDDEIAIDVDNDGPGAARGPLIEPSGLGGLGIVGMQERIAMLGGVLDTGPLGTGGFHVGARFPLDVGA